MPYSLVLRRSRRKKAPPVIGGDPLSDLPELIKENILVRLPVKEAVRTCLISRSWKEAWIWMPEIVLRDEHCVSFWTDHWRHKNSLEVRQFKKVADKVLSCTRGSIMKFDIASGLDLSKPMDKWIPILVRRKIEHLVIELDWYGIPSTFFSCHSLRHVSLHKCRVEVPKSINGLEKLQTLDLNRCQISMKDIERWVASCPSLQNLTLDSFVLNPDSNLKICSCSLRIIHFWGCVKKLKLETPNLETACITKFGPSDNMQKGSFVEDFKYLHGLERLEMNHAYLRELVEDPPFETLPFHFSNLKEIQIEMNPGDYQEAGFVLALFHSAEKLQCLTLKLCSGDNKLGTNWWSSKADRDSFKHLQTVKLCYLTPSEFEYSFLSFLLLSAPVLTRVFLDEVGSTVDVEKLHRLEKISNNAQVIVCSNVLDS